MGDHDGLESVITIGWNTHSDHLCAPKSLLDGSPVLQTASAPMSPVCAKGPLPASRQVYMREQLAKLSRDPDLAKAFN
jgi:hypothetical protein